MKRIINYIIISFAFMMIYSVNAQMTGFTYQAVAIDETGKEIAGMDVKDRPYRNKEINVKFSILDGSATGVVQYQETHGTTTNAQGLFTLIIGSGTSTNSGAFTKIQDVPWAKANQYLKVEIDLYKTNDYKLVSVQPLMAVPYAMYAGSAGNSSGSGNNSTLQIISSIEPKGSNCAEGGLKFEYGVDVNSNGVLEPSEIDALKTNYVCNGKAGNDSGINNGSNVGDMIFWDGTKWTTLPAGTSGQVLVFCNGVPTWGSCPTGITGLTTTAVSAISYNSASSGGNVSSDGGTAITSKGVCWSTNVLPTVLDNKTYNGTGIGIFSSSLSNLIPNTTYYLRAYATNAHGTSYGNQVSFTTATSVIPNIITNTIIGVSDNNATCGGTIVNDGGANITAKGVCWATTINPTIANFKTNDGIGISNFNSTLTNLVGGTTYYVRAYATNINGTTYGNQLSFTTSGVAPVFDIDGNIYETVEVGGQIWMKKNLNVIKYNDGTPITKITDEITWCSTKNPAYCYYNNDSSKYANPYGALYNYYAIQTNKLCPVGWHVPTHSDWSRLLNFLGGIDQAGGKLKIVDTTYFKSPNFGASNYSNLSFVGNGIRSNYLGSSNLGFEQINTHAYLWVYESFIINDNSCPPTNTKIQTYEVNLGYLTQKVFVPFNIFQPITSSTTTTGSCTDANRGLAVRCIKD